MSWFKKADDTTAAPLPPIPGAKPPMTEKQDVATATTIAKDLKTLIDREKAEGDKDLAKLLEDALKKVEDFLEKEKKAADKEKKEQEKDQKKEEKLPTD